MSSPKQPFDPNPGPPLTGASKPQRLGRKRLQNRWLHLVLALAVGGGIGAAAGGASASTRADRSDQSASQARSERDAARTEAASSVSKASSDKALGISQAKTDAAATVAGKQGEIDKRKGELDQQQAGLDKQKADQDKRSADLDTRLAAVSGVETAAKANEFAGNGTYRVGTDIQPGTYTAPPSTRGNCYFARLSSLAGDGVSSIIDNDNSSGQVVIQVRPSDVGLKVSGCSTFKKTG